MYGLHFRAQTAHEFAGVRAAMAQVNCSLLHAHRDFSDASAPAALTLRRCVAALAERTFGSDLLGVIESAAS